MNRDYPRRLVLKLAAAGAVVLLAAGGALAQDWPNRPVTIVVPYGPGASNDTFTRAIAQVMSSKLGQPFVVENRAGAGGFTGTNSVAQAAPDGYTFVEAPNSIVGFKPLMKVEMDPLVNLTPIGLLAKAPTAMVVPAGLPVNSVQEFIDYAKAHPDTTFYGMAGIGTTQQQHAEMFNRSTGLKLKGVNYTSSADAQTDLVAGRLQVMFVTIASTLGQIQGGQLKLLAYTDDNSPPGVPEAPVLADVGVPNMEGAQIFWALFGPPGLPDELRDKMNAALNDAIADPAFVALAAKSGATPAPVSPAEFVDLLKAEGQVVQGFIADGIFK